MFLPYGIHKLVKITVTCEKHYKCATNCESSTLHNSKMEIKQICPHFLFTNADRCFHFYIIIIIIIVQCMTRCLEKQNCKIKELENINCSSIITNVKRSNQITKLLNEPLETYNRNY